MASGNAAPTANEYISHHLVNFHVGHGFWTFHLDTLIMSGLVGIVVFGIITPRSESKTSPLTIAMGPVAGFVTRCASASA